MLLKRDKSPKSNWAELESEKKRLEEERKILEADKKKFEAERRDFEVEKLRFQSERALEAEKNRLKASEEYKANERDSRRLKRSKRITLWLGFGVIATVGPFFLGIAFDGLSGYNILSNKMEYIGDLLLIVVAVSAGLCNICIVSKKTVKRNYLILFTAVFLASSLSMYSFFYRKSRGLESGIDIVAIISLVQRCINNKVIT